ncbi:hypothetical protein DH2020_007971 [Rehmannia glutinosa]|uniref:Bifunctional inhibitor/plant lipid transfer protein/seed storage helical domain-containing protein n=1 Tax=Rehmannia glutinosa TaxID=99300 RepID=A0ABR0TZR6_REHGL
MAILRTYYVVLVTILIIGVIAIKIDTALGQHPSALIFRPRCWGIANFIAYCSFYILKYDRYARTPDEKCCARARKTDIVLFCKRFVNDEIYRSKSVVVLAHYCGNPLPKGTKCGSNYVHNNTTLDQLAPTLMVSTTETTTKRLAKRA